jgi:hypothetical protein
VNALAVSPPSVCWLCGQCNCVGTRDTGQPDCQAEADATCVQLPPGHAFISSPRMCAFVGESEKQCRRWHVQRGPRANNCAVSGCPPNIGNAGWTTGLCGLAGWQRRCGSRAAWPVQPVHSNQVRLTLGGGGPQPHTCSPNIRCAGAQAPDSLLLQRAAPGSALKGADPLSNTTHGCPPTSDDGATLLHNTRVRSRRAKQGARAPPWPTPQSPKQRQRNPV